MSGEGGGEVLALVHHSVSLSFETESTHKGSYTGYTTYRFGKKYYDELVDKTGSGPVKQNKQP